MTNQANFNPSVSIIMPALNEEKNIENAVTEVLGAFCKLSICGEIIIVNDGSTDKTQSIVDSLMSQHKEIRCIQHSQPCGVGASYFDGVKAARGEFLTWIPGDGEGKCFEILRYLSLMEKVDIVIPFVFNKEARGWQRNFLSYLYNSIVNLSFGMRLNYMNGTTIYRTAVIKETPANEKGFFFQAEILIKILRKGYLYGEVPTSLGERKHGSSRALTAKEFYKVGLAYLRILSSIYLAPRLLPTNWTKMIRDKKQNVHPDSVTYRKLNQIG